MQRPVQRPSALVVVLLVVAVVSTAGWVATAVRRPAPATTAAAQPHDHRSHDHGTHSHGGTAQNTVPTAPRDGVVTMQVPELPPAALNFLWKPEHLLLAPGQQVEVKVANADYMQHNFTFEPAKVAKNLPVDATTTIRFTAPTTPGVYRFYCKYHLQMMEGAVTVR